MPVEITMPQLSDTMTEGTVVKWNKKEGEKVAVGGVLAVLATGSEKVEDVKKNAGAGSAKPQAAGAAGAAGTAGARRSGRRWQARCGWCSS